MGRRIEAGAGPKAPLGPSSVWSTNHWLGGVFGEIIQLAFCSFYLGRGCGCEIENAVVAEQLGAEFVFLLTFLLLTGQQCPFCPLCVCVGVCSYVRSGVFVFMYIHITFLPPTADASLWFRIPLALESNFTVRVWPQPPVLERGQSGP